MTTKYVEQLATRILGLLPPNQRGDRARLLADSCSELSRLVASWIHTDEPAARLCILKGTGVMETDRAHDILAIDEAGTITLLDPTIWQFFPEEDSILVGEFKSLDEALAAAQKYGGRWQVSERLTEFSTADQTSWLKIIKQNIAA